MDLLTITMISKYFNKYDFRKKYGKKRITFPDFIIVRPSKWKAIQTELNKA